MASFNFGQNSPKQARMATITNISNIIRVKKKKNSYFNFPNSFRHKTKSMFEQHSRSILMINIRGIVDKLTKKDD